MKQPTLKDYVKDYLDYCTMVGRTEGTVQYHRSCLKRFVNWSYARDKRYLEEIDKQHIRSYWMYLKKNYKGVESAARSVRAFFYWLEAEDIITGANPMRAAGFPRKPQETIEPLTDAEISALIDGARQGRNGRRDSAIILWLYDTGLRVSEATSVRLRDIDFENSQVTVRRKMHKTGTVVFSYRTTRAVKAYLRYERIGYSESDFLFVSEQNTPLDRYSVRLLLHRAAKRSGIDKARVSPHKLRHSFAVAFLRNGGSALHLQAMLGHSTLEMTKRYVSFSGRDFREAHKKFSPVLNMKHNQNEAED